MFFSYYPKKMNQHLEEFWFREKTFFWFADEDKKRAYYASLKDWKSEYVQRRVGSVTVLVGMFAAIAFLRSYFDPFLVGLLAFIAWTVYYLFMSDRLGTVNFVLTCLYGEQAYDENEKWKLERDEVLYLLSKMKKLAVTSSEFDLPVILTEGKNVKEFSKDVYPVIKAEIETDIRVKLGKQAGFQEQDRAHNESAISHIVSFLMRSRKILLYYYDEKSSSIKLMKDEKPKFKLKFVPPVLTTEPELAIIVTPKA